ncbi:hypothetical protein ACFLWZ_04550 [Chloroflexota bacterium]
MSEFLHVFGILVITAFCILSLICIFRKKPYKRWLIGIVIGIILVIIRIPMGSSGELYPTPTPTLDQTPTPISEVSSTPPPKETMPITITAKPPEEAFLTLETELIGETLLISGETNLPDDSRLGVSVVRLYKCENDPEWYVGDFAPNNTVTVTTGKYIDICDIDVGESWYDWLQNFYRKTGNPEIVEVSDELSVSIIFTPKAEQPDSVYQILGQNAENLKGEQVESVGKFYVLEASTEVYLPFNLLSSPTTEEPETAEPTSEEPTPTPTPTPAPTPTTITSETDLRQFLEANFSTLETSLGPTHFTFTIYYNDTIVEPYDYMIWVEYDLSFFYDLQYSNKISTEMNHKVVDELSAHQGRLARAVIEKMPNTKLTGRYIHCGYEYPTIKVGFYSYSYFTWVNYSPATAYTDYDEAKITDFTWFSRYDDSLLR